MTASLPVHTTAPLRVTYRDTDRMGYTYHSQYLVWFEIGRTDLLRAQGTTYRQWEDDHGVFLPVRECSIRYHSPARYDDLVVVKTEIVQLTKASIRFQYTVERHEDGVALASGETTHAFVNRDGQILRVAHTLLPHLFH